MNPIPILAALTLAVALLALSSCASQAPRDNSIRQAIGAMLLEDVK